MRIIVLAAVVLIALGGIALLRAIYSHYLSAAKWSINERTSGAGRLYVELVHPKNSPLIVADLNPSDESFDWDLEEARSWAKSKAISLNARAKLLK